MKSLLKFFPLMPAEKDTGKLVLAILFYLFVPSTIGAIIGFILGLTIILLPLAFIVGTIVSAYTIAGIVFAVLCYAGQKF